MPGKIVAIEDFISALKQVPADHRADWLQNNAPSCQGEFEMSTPKTVSELYPDPWLRPDDLNGRTFTLTIARVTLEQLHNPRTNGKDLKVILDFGRSKRLPLNKTQCLAVADIARTEIFQEWQGTAVTLAPGRAHNGKATIIIRPAPVVTEPVTAETETSE